MGLVGVSEVDGTRLGGRIWLSGATEEASQSEEVIIMACTRRNGHLMVFIMPCLRK